MNAEYWHPIWEAKSSDTVQAMSGRSNYDRHRTECLVRDAVRALRLSPDDTLLDIGCAAGLMGDHLRAIVAQYVGVDYSSAAIAAFHARVPGAVLYVASAVSLPFSDKSFTKTLMSSVTLCLSKAEGLVALREMRRVTADGGVGFCSGNLRYDPQWDPEKLVCREGCSCYRHATAYTESELMRLAISAGWGLAASVPTHPDIPQGAYMFDLVLQA